MNKNNYQTIALGTWSWGKGTVGGIIRARNAKK